ncbi:hypothetical protein GCM10023193_47360 [Planotetraspora kaengkrachanensis]|uniref:Uncharacterized protein n=1 Tax=Planotetraspora kaengkrachanensis TaxID=575193 RepID=A0A8J3LX12_9ACTN|nr:hypothetical protein Pka01_38050 [Planotetraspora kaengkrachanensis]
MTPCGVPAADVETHLPEHERAEPYQRGDIARYGPPDPRRGGSPGLGAAGRAGPRDRI